MDIKILEYELSSVQQVNAGDDVVTLLYYIEESKKEAFR